LLKLFEHFFTHTNNWLAATLDTHANIVLSTDFVTYDCIINTFPPHNIRPNFVVSQGCTINILEISQ